jgi:uncharacterized protein (TIGR03083 family)
VLGWRDLRSAIRERTDAVGALLCGSDPDARVVGSLWTIAELGAHLVSIPRRYLRMIDEPQDFPTSLTAMNEVELDAIGLNNPDELADRLRTDVHELLEVLGDDGERAVPFFSQTLTARHVGAVLYGEVLLHGLDLARTVGAGWSIGNDDAATVLYGVLPSIGAAVDPVAATKAQGTYHLHIRQAHDWTIQIHGTTATIAPGKPDRADLHVSADPKAFLLTSYGRAGRLRSLLSGQIIGYGRKPWLAMRFSNVFRET